MTTAVLEREETTVASVPEARLVDGVSVTVSYARVDDLRVSDDEIRAYLARGSQQYRNTAIVGLDLAVDGEDVGITYDLKPLPFERIRRITGYLVGTLDRFNDAKRAEESDRVKHSVSNCCAGR